MARRVASLLVVGCLIVTFATTALAQGVPTPHRFAPGTDENLVQVVGTDGTRWAAWTWRNGAETDIAISSLDATGGLWSEPRLLGEDDGNDQTLPSLTVDAYGSVYLAYAEPERGVIRVSALARSQKSWTQPQIVSGRGEQATAPTLQARASEVVLAYRNGEEVVIRTFPLIALPHAEAKLTDGPDPVGQWPPPPPEDDDRDDDRPPNTDDQHGPRGPAIVTIGSSD